MKRILFACVAVAISAGAVPAASPAVELAIKTIEAVANDPTRLKLFCELNRLLQEHGDNEDPVIQKRVEDLVAKLGSEFATAWEVGDELDENSEDGQEFYAAVDALAEKCT